MVTELPDLVSEFVDLSKSYLRQETIEPAKRLGRYAGFVAGAGLAFALAGVFFGIALTRLFLGVLPDGDYWTVLGYLLGVLSIGAVAGAAAGVTKQRVEKNPPSPRPRIQSQGTGR